jgi:diaminopimelate decarboxylase
MKVNSSFALLKHGRKLSCRVDVSSLGELEKALVA